MVLYSGVVSEVKFGCLKSIRGTWNDSCIGLGDLGLFVPLNMLVKCFSKECFSKEEKNGIRVV